MKEGWTVADETEYWRDRANQVGPEPRENCAWIESSNSGGDGTELLLGCTADYWKRKYPLSIAPNFCPRCGGKVTVSKDPEDG